jgi:hypothetical protein
MPSTGLTTCAGTEAVKGIAVTPRIKKESVAPTRTVLTMRHREKLQMTNYLRR